MLYIYNQARNDFIEFLDVGKVVVMQGPRGRDGDVSFKDLTPKQINMLKSGPRGDNGPQGIQGPRGLQGLRGEQGIQGEKGDIGESNYDLWLENGNTGTLSDFLEASRGQRGLPGDANFQDITQEQLNGFILGAFMKKRISNECFIKNKTPNIVFMRGFGEDGSYKDGEIILEDSTGEARTIDVVEKVNTMPTIEGYFMQADRNEVYGEVRVLDIFGDKSCKAYYDFNNNIENKIVNAVATVDTGAISYSAGKYLNTINFPSMVASRIVDNSYSYLDNGKYSISFFLYYSPTAINSYHVLAGVGSREIGFDNRSPSKYITISIGGGFYRLNETSEFKEEGWYHIVVNTANTIADVECYINGILMTTKVYQGGYVGNSNTKLMIGAGASYNTTWPCKQKIDILRTFDRHLTKDKVIKLRDEYDKANGFYLYHNALSTVVSAKHQFRVFNFPSPRFSAKEEILDSGLEDRDLYMFNGQLLVK